MRIAITGSSCLAKSIKDRLELCSFINPASQCQEPVEVQPLRIEDDIDFADFNVFINNAHVDFGQVDLLHRLYQAWQHDNSKYIINISSRAHQPNISKGYLYSAQKAALNHLAHNLTYNSTKKCKITTVNLGLMNDPLPSLSHDEVAQQIEYLLSLPFHIEINDISLQHNENYTLVQKLKDERRSH
jgi:NAD(P)-dependent dehydrogenase (short-subunit alcohol dehydrogenase family)